MKWSPQDFDHLITGVLSHESWFPLHRPLIIVLGLESAAVLQFLINYYKQLKTKDKSGWFYCTVDKLEEKLGISSKPQIRILQNLESSGCIEMKKTGMPARRHIRINNKKIAEIIVEQRTSEDKKGLTSDSQMGMTGQPDPGVTLTPNCGRHNYNIRDRIKRVSGGKAASPTQDGLLPKDWETKAGEELWKILEKNGADLVVRLRVRVSTLANQIVRLNTRGKIPKEEIKIILHWLRDHYADVHTPKIYKVVDLYNNWGRIRDARLRWLEDNDVADPSGNGSDTSEVDAMEVYQQLQMLGVAQDYDQGDIDLAAGMLGVSEGVFTVKDMPR